MRPGQHVVYAYNEDAALHAAVAEWVAPSLRAGGGALLACATERLDPLRAELRARGIDIDRAEAEGRFAAYDAESTLARFMTATGPHGAVFKRLARQLIGDVARVSAPGTIRVWGEMVNILAKRGEARAAHALEQLWNEVVADQDIQLLCSYQLDELDPATHAQILLEICETHTDLVPHEGNALEGAVVGALDEVFGSDDARLLRGILPTRRALLDRMSYGCAVIVSLRALDPILGEEVAQRARRRLVPAISNHAAPR